MSETVGKHLGNFFGTFLEYDANNNSSILREFMRLKFRVDVRKRLKRKKKICKKDKTKVIVQCKYEKLGDFCFVCGSCHIQKDFAKRNLKEMELRSHGNGEAGFEHHQEGVPAVVGVSGCVRKKMVVGVLQVARKVTTTKIRGR